MDFLLINDWLNRGFTNYSFKWDHFLLVFLLLAFGIWLGFFLRNKDIKTVKIVLYVLWGVSIAVGATFYTLVALACRKGIGGFFEDTLGVILPLHSCFMFVFLFPVAMFAKNKYIKKAASNFLVVVNMIMGFITLFVGCPIPYFSAFSFFGLQTIIYHAIIVIVPFVMLLTRLYEIEKEDIKYGLLAFGILATSVWIFDAITGCDYFYIYDGHSFPVFQFISENVHHLVWTLITISVYIVTAIATHFFVLMIKGQVAKQREINANNVANDKPTNL